jgi:hypothetical protein
MLQASTCDLMALSFCRFPMDAEAIRRLIREILLPSVDACLQDPDCVGTYHGPAYLYHALLATAHVAANKLIVRLHMASQQDWSELDYELCQLTNALAICMDEKPVTRRLDDMIKDPSSQQHMIPQAACIADTCKVIQSQDAEGNVQVEEVCLLQCSLLNKFGTHGGLDNVIQVSIAALQSHSSRKYQYLVCNVFDNAGPGEPHSRAVGAGEGAGLPAQGAHGDQLLMLLNSVIPAHALSRMTLTRRPRHSSSQRSSARCSR